MNMQSNITPLTRSPAQSNGMHLIDSLQKVGLCTTRAQIDEMIEALIELADMRDGDCDLEDSHDLEWEGYLE